MENQEIKEDKVLQAPRGAQPQAAKVLTYLEQIKAALDKPAIPKFLTTSDIKNNEIYKPVEELMPIFLKYKDGRFDLNTAQEDILKILSISARLAEYSARLKANIRHQSNVRKIEYSKAQVTIKEFHQRNLDAGTCNVRLTDNDIKSLAESSLEELYQIYYEYDVFAELLSNMFDLSIHMTTILNSINKRVSDELKFKL